MYLYVISRFPNAITLARKYIFSFLKKFLVANILLYQKQLKTENRPQTPQPVQQVFIQKNQGPTPGHDFDDPKDVKMSMQRALRPIPEDEVFEQLLMEFAQLYLGPNQQRTTQEAQETV